MYIYVCFLYLEDLLVVQVVEHGAVDLAGLQGHPVEDRHPELGLDRLLDLHRWRYTLYNNKHKYIYNNEHRRIHIYV